jgi:hypothetical protein
MLARSHLIAIVAATACVLIACTDKAKPDYDRCVKELEDQPDHIEQAADMCAAAVAADPGTTSGKAAAARLKDLQVEVAQRAKAKADAKVKADAEAAAQAQAAAQAAAAQAARDEKCETWCVEAGPGVGHHCVFSKKRCEDFEKLYASSPGVGVTRSCYCKDQ